MFFKLTINRNHEVKFKKSFIIPRTIEAENGYFLRGLVNLRKIYVQSSIFKCIQNMIDIFPEKRKLNKTNYHVLINH